MKMRLHVVPKAQFLPHKQHPCDTGNDYQYRTYAKDNVTDKVVDKPKYYKNDQVIDQTKGKVTDKVIDQANDKVKDKVIGNELEE